MRKVIPLLALLPLGLAAGCGGSGENRGTQPAFVSGVAAGGAAMTGNVYLKDAGNRETSMSLGSGGTFRFDVSGRSSPFMLRAGSLYSMRAGSGRANINPLSTLMVAELGGFGTPAEVNTFYTNPGASRMHSMMGNMPAVEQKVRQMMAPLLSVYGAADQEPITSPYILGTGIDRMFDDLKMTMAGDGTITMMYANGTTVFTGPMGNIMGGSMMSDNIMSPPSASGVVIKPMMAAVQVNGTHQFTANVPVVWSVVTPNGGSITSAGLFRAPSVEGIFTIKATSVADPSKAALASVQVGGMGMNMGM